VADELVGTTARSDAELITSVRVGETAAYEELYRRHVDAAMSVARHLTNNRADAEDVVSEAFARVLSALQRGAGPEMAFRPYLLTSVRNAFYDRTRKDKRLEVTDEVPEDLGQVLAAAAASENDAERKLAAAAFASLPERWQLVLWHTEVEGRTPAEVGPLLGLAPNAVAALAYRAREGLRQAYLNAHIQAKPPAECAEFVPKLGAYVRDDLSNRDRKKVEDHLAGCERCRAIVEELEEAGSRLRIALVPIIAGIPAAAYLSGLGIGGGVLAGVTRAGQRFKELGPAGQVAAVAGALVVASSLVVGALAITQNVGHGPREEAGVTVPTTSGASVSTAPSASEAPGSSALPTLPTVPPTPATTPVVTVPPSGTTSPTIPTTNAPTTAAPTTGPTTPTNPPTTAGPTTPPTTAVPPPAELTVSMNSAGPTYAGQDAALPVSVGNAAPTAGATSAQATGAGGSFGRAVPMAFALVPAQTVDQPGPATQPTVNVPLPDGVTFGSVDNPEWTCTADPTNLQCVLPALNPGETSQAIIHLAVDPNAPATITLQPTVADGTEAPVAGPPLVINVQPTPAGVSDVVVDKADLALIGNSLLTCNPADVANNCVTARDDPAAAGRGQADKSRQNMIWVDVDQDPSTFNSSTATLSLPPGAEVLTAKLFWGGTTLPGTGGQAPPDPNARGTLLLVPPSGGPGMPVQAATVSADGSNPARYVASADVTALVAAGGAGVYTGTNLQTATGPNAFGGWALQVIYRDPAAPLRLVAVADGIVTLNKGGTATINLDGLEPSPSPRDGTLSFVAFEGDYDIVPEQVAVNDQPLSNPANPADNPMNGSVTTPGDRAPAYVNNFGFDADQFAVAIAPDQASVVVTANTQADRFRITGVGIAVPV
jgi:RNA polymerase sigma factor (sigma-70 family)